MVTRFIDIPHKAFFTASSEYTIWFSEQVSIGMWGTFSLIAEVTTPPTVSLPGDQSVFRLFQYDSNKLEDCLKTSITYDPITINDKLYVQILFVCNADIEGDYIESFYIDGNEYQIGCQVRDENEFYKINLINRGVELPESIKDALYQTDLNEERTDWIVLNNKYLELLQNYMDVIGCKGSYKSLFNSLKWFNYGDLVELREVWSHNTEDGVKFGDFPTETIMSDEFKKSLSVYTKTTYFVLRHNVEDFVIDDKTDEYEKYVLNKIQALEDSESPVPADLYKISLWCKDEFRMKMYLLGLYFEQYFMPIHLDLIRSCVEDVYYGEDFKISFSGCGGVISKITYYTPTGDLDYGIIPAEGGSISPTYSYVQHWSDVTGEEGDIDSGGYVVFSSDDFEINPETGTIIVGENDKTEDTVIGTVTMTIYINGMIGIVTVDVIQSKANVVITYDDVHIISFTYGTLKPQGGTQPVTLSYSQVWYDNYGNAGIITNGATLEFTSSNSETSLDEYGNLTYPETNSLDTMQVAYIRVNVSLNGSSTYSTISVYQAPYVYLITNLSLEYDIIGQEGGTVYPKYSYDIYKTYEDYSAEYHDGGEVRYFNGIVDDTYTGVITVDENTSYEQKDLGEVIMTVKMSNASEQISTEVYQEAKVRTYTEDDILKGIITWKSFGQDEKTVDISLQGYSIRYMSLYVSDTFGGYYDLSKLYVDRIRVYDDGEEEIVNTFYFNTWEFTPYESIISSNEYTYSINNDGTFFEISNISDELISQLINDESGYSGIATTRVGYLVSKYGNQTVSESARFSVRYRNQYTLQYFNNSLDNNYHYRNDNVEICIPKNITKYEISEYVGMVYSYKTIQDDPGSANFTGIYLGGDGSGNIFGFSGDGSRGYWSRTYPNNELDSYDDEFDVVQDESGYKIHLKFITVDE